MAGPFYDPGQYHLHVSDLALGEAKSTSNPQVVLRGKVIARLRVGSDGEEFSEPVAAQYDRTIYLTVTEDSRDMILKKLRYSGWAGDRFETLAKDLVGKGVRAVCKIEVSKGGKFDGQNVEKWDLALPPLELKPLENKPDVAKKLNALFGKLLKDGAQTEAPAPVAAKADDGGVPF